MIKLQHIERVFLVGEEEVHALRDVDFSASGGEYIAIMGPSGSGKSTLLNILGLLDRPDGGTYELDNIMTTSLDDKKQANVRRHKIGFVFQFFHLVPRLTAEQNVELPLVLAGVDKTERKKRVLETLESFGIGDRVHHRPDQLSGGQRQRVAIARATIMKPTVILADEPTGNLDRASGNDVVDILEELNSQGITLIMVTHDPELGERAKRRIKMVDGRIEGDTATQS
ncbi:MAG: ABC transporter ATP-binding protein [Desulfobulbaceae bacterium]|jgi:putative ABC transport system ATP-binding protein|nr:ABC transporter ATP-binding protein [Desulfobulbaceae bacterium]HKJ13396.1 ABC transporter ATP-binding protein [Desulfobulbales bacterium]MDH3541040.1 ABC transporter ATP-binding protein [Desulfobulbaceae bacterium]MDH3776208.1 ABC transporter ATP-binding protein [Desulfobulbaceae bacterium]MDH3781366.1 ABC transporter ATP-binding protein [Desulfobulbaceae bacterium]